MTTIKVTEKRRDVQSPDAAGEFTITLEEQRDGRTLVTDWIDTGLGPGRHPIRVALIDKDGFENGPITSERLVFGTPGLFSDSDYVPAVPEILSSICEETATGRFKVAIRFVRNFIGGSVSFAWWAVKEELTTPKQRLMKEAESFYIENPPKQVMKGRSYTLRCHVEGDEDVEKKILWSVAEGGGAIDSYGCYTAPDKAGVFEVTAKLEGTDRRSSVYIMVRS